MTTVSVSRVRVWLAAAFLIATAVAVLVETALPLLGIHREPPYYLVALFAAGVFLADFNLSKG